MTCGSPNTTCQTPIYVFAAVSLRIILYKFQIILLAKLTYFISISIASIKMDDADGFCLLSNTLFNKVVIYLQRIQFWLNQHRHKIILRDSKNSCNVSISRDNHLIARLHYTHLNIGPEYPNQCIQSIGTTNTIVSTDKLSVVLFESFILLPLQIPTTIYNTCYCCIYFVTMQGGNIFQR